MLGSDRGRRQCAGSCFFLRALRRAVANPLGPIYRRTVDEEAPSAPSNAPESSWTRDEVVLRSIHDSVRTIAVAIVAVIVAFALTEFFLGVRGYGKWEALVDLSTIAVVLALRPRSTKPSTYERAHRTIAGYATVCLVNITGTSVLFGVPDNLMYVAFIIIGAGATSLSWRGLAWTAGLAAVLAVPAALSLEGGQVLPTAIVSVVAGTSTAAVILQARRRHTQRLTLLRIATERQAAELRVAYQKIADELAQRVRAENERVAMAEAQARMQEELSESRRLEALGTLAGGVAHDMNNVLAAIALVSEASLSKGGLPGQVREDMVQISAATRQGASLTRNLLGFARRGKRRDETVDVVAMVDDAVSLLRRTLPKGLDLRVHVDDDVSSVKGDEGQLGHVLINLGVNARDATDGHGQIDVTVSEVSLEEDRHLAPGRYLEIAVRDDGAGMSPSTLEKVFEPFFSTKAGPDHAGLGLSMVFGTARQHEGDVRIESQLGEGTVVRVLLPVAAEPRQRSSGAEPLRQPPRGLRVMVVDDEPLVRSGARRLLRTWAADVTVVSGGAPAVARYEQGERFDLVVLDMAMPDMDGTDTFYAVRAIDPEAAVVITSGYPLGADVQALIEDGAVAFLDKPYRHDEIEQVLCSLPSRSQPTSSAPPLTG